MLAAILYGGTIYAGGIGAVIKSEYVKSKQLELSDQVKAKIQDEGLYHITSKEAAMKIMESGYLLPTKGVMDNHFAKERYGDKFADFVYMFAGKPTPELYEKNLSHRVCEDGTIYAIRYKPNEYDINNYTERLGDGAITHEGVLDISNSNPEIVRMKFEKGKLKEIPLDEEVKVNPLEKISGSKAVKFLKALPHAAKEIWANCTLKDMSGKLKRTIAIRRDVNKMLQQYNNDSQMKEFSFEKDGESYSVTTVGTKMADGRPLSGFRVSKQNGELDKNVYMEAFDITTIPEDKLGEFIGTHMDTNGIQSEYIGRAVMKNGKVEQQIDEGFMHNFNAKQLRAVQNNSLYSKYVEAENKKKTLQLKKLQETFKRVPARLRKDALEMVEQARNGKLLNRSKEAVKDFVKDESSGLVIGG